MNAIERAKVAAQARHQSWLKRKSGSDISAWRPAKRYRVAAKHFCQMLVNQVRLGLGLRGLADFVVCPDRSGTWASWRTWRHLLLSVDQGELCATNWMKSIGSDLTVFCDFCHGYKNYFLATVKDMRLMSFWWLMVVTMNAEHGPQSDEARHTQVSKFLMECFGQLHPQDERALPGILRRHLGAVRRHQQRDG